jgi:3-deoxy-7-phosphoheptulonate synthase
MRSSSAFRPLADRPGDARKPERRRSERTASPKGLAVFCFPEAPTMNAKHATDDVRIRAIKELSPPSHLVREFPLREPAAELVYETRQAIHRILHGMDDRLLVVVGPCSIHDPRAALEYARRLAGERERLRDRIEIVMRVYFEKPRTTVGWKGLINDPELDGSFDINRGLRLARELLVEINELGLPAGTEFLDMITPQYVADLISWGAIGARTTESQVHRELASGLSCPVGFKNGTDGNVRIALDAIKAASQPHHFLSVTKGGHSAIVATNGNEDCHLILRGGRAPNFGGLWPPAPHGNSQKKHENQLAVARDIADQLSDGESRVFGVMVESHLVAGRQDLVAGRPLVYGQSITDACIGWEDTIAVLDTLAEGVAERRVALAN